MKTHVQAVMIYKFAGHEFASLDKVRDGAVIHRRYEQPSEFL